MLFVRLLFIHFLYTLFIHIMCIRNLLICLGESSLDRMHFIVLPNGVSDIMSREEIYAIRRVNDERNREVVSFIYARYV